MINEHYTNYDLRFVIDKNSALDCRLVTKVFVESSEISLQNLLGKNP